MARQKRRWAAFLLRLVIGYGFMAHGLAKMSHGPEALEKLLGFTGVPYPHYLSQIIPYTEFVGGIAILTGTFVTIVAVPLIIIMLMGIFTVHLPYGFSTINTTGLNENGPVFGPPGFEMNLLYIAGLVSLILTGAGAFSFDSWRINRNKVKTVSYGSDLQSR